MIDSVSQITSLHGTMLGIFNIGVLLIGQPGIGKSELALGLLDRGHCFIADDVVDVERCRDKLLVQSPVKIRNFLHLRRIGLIDVKEIYGEKLITQHHPLDLIVHLVDTEFFEATDPINPPQTIKQILGINKPEIILSIIGGRNNLPLLVEILIKNFVTPCKKILPHSEKKCSLGN